MYDIYIMHRTQIYLNEEQEAKLSQLAAAAGVSKSTWIRTAIDAYLEEDDEAARLSSFRSAVVAAAGTAPDLPRGADYVRASRDEDLVRQEGIETRRRG